MFGLNIDAAVFSKIFCIGYLLILTVCDIRNRCVNIRYLAAGAGLVILYQIIWKEQPWFQCAAGALVGLVFVGISKMTKEDLGYGDSYLITILGILMGFWEILLLLFIAFSLAAVFSILLVVINQSNRKKAFPFIPFITAGYLILLIMKQF